MNGLLGIRPRSEFDGIHIGRRFAHASKKECEKYGIGRIHWRVYKNLLLFYMNTRDEFSLLPEITRNILRISLSIALKERIEESMAFGWNHMFRPSVGVIDGNDIEGGLWEIRKEPDYIHRDRASTNVLFIDKDAFIYDNTYVDETLFDDQFMETQTNQRYSEESYRFHRREVLKGYIPHVLFLFVWIIDAVVFQFGLIDYLTTHSFFPFKTSNRTLFHSPKTCDTNVECILSIPLQLIANPLWFMRALYHSPLFPSNNDINVIRELINPFLIVVDKEPIMSIVTCLVRIITLCSELLVYLILLSAEVLVHIFTIQ